MDPEYRVLRLIRNPDPDILPISYVAYANPYTYQPSRIEPFPRPA